MLSPATDPEHWLSYSNTLNNLISMIISSYKYANVKHDFQLEILHNEL